MATKRLVVKKANRIIDVFFGETGWTKDEWARFAVIPGGYIKHLGGATLSTQDFQEIRNYAKEMK